VYGKGQFALLFISTLAQRSADPQAFLPATEDLRVTKNLSVGYSMRPLRGPKPGVSATSGIPRPTWTTVSMTLWTLSLGSYRVAAQARQGTPRNGAGALQGIALTQVDIQPLVAFLKSLHEDSQ
jgi:hypothetical protein